MTHALVNVSPAIDLDVGCSTGFTEDQRGYPRPVGAGCDAGSFEFANHIPIADAGANQTVVLGNPVCFDGSASFDADGDPLTYFWELTEWPAGSTAELEGPTSETSCFTADLAGTYEVRLVVNDGEVDSLPSIVEVTAEMAASSGEAVIAVLEETSVFVSSLDSKDFDNKNKQKVLANQIDTTIVLVDEELYTEALSKLENSILGKVDGCVESEGPEEEPDKNDWISECTSQETVYDLVQEAIGIGCGSFHASLTGYTIVGTASPFGTQL